MVTTFQPDTPPLFNILNTRFSYNSTAPWIGLFAAQKNVASRRDGAAVGDGGEVQTKNVGSGNSAAVSNGTGQLGVCFHIKINGRRSDHLGVGDGGESRCSRAATLIEYHVSQHDGW